MENLLNGYFYYNYFTPKFSNWYFSELLFLVSDKKINKIYQREWMWLWTLEITLWKLRLRKIILHKTDFAPFTVLPRVTSWPVCFTDKYLSKTSFNKPAGKSVTLTTSKMEFFVILVNAVN